MKDFNIQPDSTYFIDTNMWLYSFIQSQSKEKTEIAGTIIKKCEIVISTQIINKMCVNLIKKVNFSKGKIQNLDADYLVSEDMQDGFNLENKLTLLL